MHLLFDILEDLTEVAQPPKVSCDSHEKPGDELSKEKKPVNETLARNYSTMRVIIFTIFAAFTAINFGYSLGYSAHFKIVRDFNRYGTNNQFALYSVILQFFLLINKGMLLLGALFGSPFAGFYLMDKVGRKYTIIFSTVISIMGWLMHLPLVNVSIASKINIYAILLVSRFLIGIGVGAASTASPVSE